MKKITLLAILSSMTYTMHAQTLPAIESALKDPNRKENEAKADVLLIDKTRIFNGDIQKDRRNYNSIAVREDEKPSLKKKNK